MRRLSIAAVLAVPLLFLAAPGTASANPPVLNSPYNGFGCGDFCLGMFKKIHQHGPLFNYGPYYGYYPFAPYGPWDQYLRYDPNFYGDAGAGQYGRSFGPLLGRHGHKSGCATCGFAHASWLHGGWFKGHTWLKGNSHSHGQPACSSCGGVASGTVIEPTGDPVARYSGFGSVAQSAVFYPSAPALNPVLDLVPTAGTMQTK